MNERRGWWTVAEVCDHLGIGRDKLRALMNATSAAGRCWRNQTGGKRPSYRFRRDQVDAWFTGVTSAEGTAPAPRRGPRRSRRPAPTSSTPPDLRSLVRGA